MHTASDNILVKQNISPQSIASGASVNGKGQDCAGYEQLLVDVEIGKVTTGNITVKLQESSDDGNADAYADIANATTGAVSTEHQKPYLFDVNLSGRKHYIRAVATVAGGGSALVGVAFHLTRGRRLPPTQDVDAIHV